METIIREESVFRIMDAMQGAKVCCIDYGNVKKGEKVLILTDTKADQRKTEVIACVCREVGAEVTIIVMEVRELPNQEPPRAVVEAMKASDIVFANLFYTVSHTNARFEAMKAGTRYMGMYDSSIDALAKEMPMQRDLIVTGTFSGFVVANTNTACAGGSSRVLRSALNASIVSICTSSIM